MESGKLTDRVRCKVTGFTGIVVAEYHYINGCIRLDVQPPMDEKGKWTDSRVFDDQQMEVLARGVVSMGENETGGPALYVDAGRPDPSR